MKKAHRIGSSTSVIAALRFLVSSVAVVMRTQRRDGNRWPKDALLYYYIVIYTCTYAIYGAREKY